MTAISSFVGVALLVYQFTAGITPGVVHWQTDKIVAGKREDMGEFDLTFDAAEACWKTQFSSPRMTSVWRVVVSGDHLTGTAQLVPGNQTVRKIDVRRTR